MNPNEHSNTNHVNDNNTVNSSTNENQSNNTTRTSSSSSVDNHNNSSSSSSIRQIIWRHYSNSLHFFGGNLFPTTTISTTSMYNNTSSTTSTTSNGSGGGLRCDATRKNNNISNKMRSINKYRSTSSSNIDNNLPTDGGGGGAAAAAIPSFKNLKNASSLSSSLGWSESLPPSRPTDQLLKLIRRRRGSTNRHRSVVAGGGTNDRVGVGVGVGVVAVDNNDNDDDSWNAVRYHIITRPSDCRFICYSSNLSTPLHAACLYRAPNDVILMILTAWPGATLLQDSEGWTPLHVHILYNNFNNNNNNSTTTLSTTDLTTTITSSSTSDPDRNIYYCYSATTTTTATESLIRLGGPQAAAQHSKYVGSALHLACRHNITLSVLAELLQVCPQQVSVQNEAGGLPANIQWIATMKQKNVLYQEHITTTTIRSDVSSNYNNNNSQSINDNNLEWEHVENELDLDLLIRLNLFIGAYKNQPILLDQAIHAVQYPLFSLQDVVQFHYDCANQSDYVGLYIKFFPQSILYNDDIDNDSSSSTRCFPFHTAASYSIKETIDAVMPLKQYKNTLVSANTGSRVQHTQQYSNNNNNNNVVTSTTNVDDTRFSAGNRQVLFQSRHTISLQHTVHVVDPLETLVRIHPEGALVQEPILHRTPLLVALLQGKRTWRTGIATLVTAAPITLEIKDSVTNLYPFQIAAASQEVITIVSIDDDDDDNPKNTDNDGNIVVDLARLETIFCLLLACPHVIS